MIVLTREEATRIANDVGVSDRPIQFHQSEIDARFVSEKYLYIGYIYIASPDQTSTDNIILFLNGDNIARVVNFFEATRQISSTTQQYFVVFDDITLGISVGRVYFYGYRIIK